ncbi:hypothetical protein RJ640_002061 [Escallonia rubra]|uniref:Integrase catalytic domain-containing protein n=1 Tax=Escallonia rubra TaxID=112253 RepID=A0AA88QBH9_9ASTE|nr:hypothetical protein RJ640_002061 [Escallonia rubra]
MQQEKGRELDEVRGRVLGRRPLPSIDEAFAEVRREASRRRVMLGGKKEVVTSGEMPMETMALAIKNNPSIDKSSGDQRNNQRGGRLWCSHCNKPGHIRDTCWDIHGKPSNWKSRGSNKGKGFQATVEEKNEDTRASSEMNGIYFTKAQLEQLQKLLSQPTFNASIQTLRTDNGKEYFQSILGEYLQTNGIIYQSSCPETPQQNGVAERKNRHLMEVARSLMFTMQVPKYLWGEAVLTASYLINRMPSKILKFTSLMSKLQLQETYPTFRSVSSIPLRTFGCTAFVHVQPQHRSKLDPKSNKCVFIGYSPTQRGYKCYSPSLRRFFASMDVTFLESQPFFGQTYLQGETLDEDKPWDEHEPEPSLQTTQPNVEPSPQTTLPNVESEPMLPLIEHKKILETGGNSRPLLVYSRRKQPLNGDKPKSLQGQESEPIPSPDEQADDYTHHDGTDHSIQKGAENLTEDLDLDLPIALRKGTRTCTQHPISKFVSCEKLSPTFRDDRGELDTLKLYLASEFELKDLGALRYFLGMEVARSKSGITVSQRKYVLDLLRDTGMLGCRPAETPMEPNAKLDIEGGKDVDREQYQRIVGKLIYLSHTRPDIAFAVSVISQFMHSPKKKHLDAVYGVLRYLKGTPGKGLFFKRGDDRMVEIYTDADWARSLVDRRSTSGYCTYVWGNLVTWRSKKQPVVARSSAEAEFRALAHGICEGIWLRRLLSELKIIKSWPMKLYCDNKAAVNIAHNPVHHDRTKHVEVDRHFIKEKIDDGSVYLMHVPTREQTADVLTKSLHKPSFEDLVSKLGMVNIYVPA